MNGDQFGLAAAVGAHLDQIAGAEIVDGEHGAELFAGAIDNRKPDQIGVIELVGFDELPAGARAARKA